MWVEKSFYGKPKYNPLEDGTMEGLMFWGLVCLGFLWGREEKGVRCFAVFFYHFSTTERCQTNLRVWNTIIKIQK